MVCVSHFTGPACWLRSFTIGYLEFNFCGVGVGRAEASDSLWASEFCWIDDMGR